MAKLGGLVKLPHLVAENKEIQKLQQLVAEFTDICKSKDNTKVEWSFGGLNKPVGVAAYDLKRFLPTSEEMESQIRLMMEEHDKEDEK